MPTTSSTAEAQLGSSLQNPAAHAAARREFQLTHEAVLAALEAHLAVPTDAERRRHLQAARCYAARFIAAWPKRDFDHPVVAECSALAVVLARADIPHAPLSTDDESFARDCASSSWPGLLALSLLAPAWLCPVAPTLSHVPDWLWGDYAAWLFARPSLFLRAGEANAFARHFTNHSAELASWLDRNPGSSAVRAAADAWQLAGAPVSLAGASATQHVRYAALRGRILRRLLARHEVHAEPLLFPRDGRRLRIGVIAPDFGDHPATRAVLPRFSHLDSDRFETVLFAFDSDFSPFEDHCRRHALDLQLLPPDLEARVDTIRDAGLDIAVFTSAGHPGIDALSVRRLAPLQLFDPAGPLVDTPALDLQLASRLDFAAPHPAQRTRPALLPAPTLVGDRDIDRGTPTEGFDRSQLGLPADALVFASAAPFDAITPEVRELWTALLAATPGSYLLLVPPSAVSVDVLNSFCRAFDAALESGGVSDQRLVIASGHDITAESARERLALADVYLDVTPVSDPAGIAAALEALLPVVTLVGPGASLLQSLTLGRLVATDIAGYREIALRLAATPAERLDLRTYLADAIARTPLFFDHLAASDAFGDLMETAYDELASSGHHAFHAARAPISAIANVFDSAAALASGRAALAAFDPNLALAHARAVLRASPADAGARQLAGSALLSLGRAARACDYLLAATCSLPAAPADLWFELARALGQDGRRNQSIEALEVSLRLDESNADAWLMLVEIAESSGATELARDAFAHASALVPADPRLARFASLAA